MGLNRSIFLEKYSKFHANSQKTDHWLNNKDMEKIVYNLHNKQSIAKNNQ